MRRKKNNSESLFDLTGASDIIFTLLLFYILTQNFLPSLSLSLPEINSNASRNKLTTTIILEKDGTIFINKCKSNLNSFRKDISKEVTIASSTINILTDKETPAGSIIKILDVLQSLNFLNVSFQGKPSVKE